MAGPREVKITIGSTSYELPITGEVVRRQVRDWAEPLQTVGTQDVNTRAYRQALILAGRVTNCFGPSRIEAGDMVSPLTVLRDCEADVLGGVITLPRREQNPAINPTATGDVDVAGDGAGSNNMNPRAAINFNGSTNAGVFTWYADDTADKAALWWNGSAWGDAGDIGAANANDIVVDVIVHKGRLLYLINTQTAGVSPGVRSSTDGATFASLANFPGGAFALYAAGSRLLDDGNTLWCFGQRTSLVARTFNIYKTTDVGATAWTTVLTNAKGQIRDVGYFYDQDGNSQIVVLTETNLYWLDTTNNVLEEILALPFAGRALARSGDELLIIMDGFRVIAYKANGATVDVSPGGEDGLPSGKDFDVDTGSHACVADSLGGPFILYSGMTIANSDDRALLLQYRGRDEAGGRWRYIWKETAAQQGHAARFIYADPVSGDLVGAINSTAANADLSTGLQFKDIESTAKLLGSAFECEEAGIVEWPKLIFPPTQLSTTMWDYFLNTEDLSNAGTQDEGVTPKYGKNGAVGTTTALAEQFSDRATVNFDATNNLGINFYTVTFHLALGREAGAGNDARSPKVLNAEVSYWKVSSLRWAYSFTVDVKGSLERGQGDVATLIANIKTILGNSTKVLLTYSDETDLAVFPVAPAEERARLGDTITRDGAAAQSQWQLTFITI